jgi:cytochrome c-type biogenesis protein CcmF
MLKVWNLSLVVGAFALTVFGTFLTRGSILESVHTFAQSAVGPLYLAFLVVVLTAGFGLIAVRSRDLQSETALDSPVSREAIFLGNNVLLSVLAFTVLIGTIFPLLDQALTGARVSVGGPYFDRTAVPVALLLVFFMGIGPLLPWRAGSTAQLAKRLRTPAWAGATTVVGLALAGVGHVAAVMTFGLAAFAGTATVGEMARGVRAHRRAMGGSVPSAVAGTVRRNHRLYGGLAAHLGLLLLVVGVAWSSSYRQQAEVTLSPGDTAHFAGYTLRYDGSTVRHDPYRTVFVSRLAVLSAGREVHALIPSLNFYPNAAEPIGTPSISKGTPTNLFRDLYVSVQSLTARGRSATFHMYLNPGVFWLWVGGAIIAVGGIVALWPPRRTKLAPARVPQRSVERVEAGS